MGVVSAVLVVLWLLPLTSGQNQTAKSAGWRSVSEVAGQASPAPASTMSAPPTSLRPTTSTTSTGRLENQTASTSPVPRGTPRATPKTPRATPETPRATPETPRATPKTPKTPKTPDGSYHGRVAAGLIGGALLVMPVGFLLIYVKKRRLQKQQMETGDWAGPSPFLGGGASGPAAAAAPRPSNRNSLSGFLRLSRRPSALPESGEEFVTVTTFGRKGSSLL